MADENRIEIVATLDIPKSVDEITSRLPELESKLAKAGAFVKIGATLNTDSLTTIKNQISEFSKGLTINVGAVNAQSIQQSISEATKNQGVKVKLSTEVDTKVVNADVDKIKKMFQLGIKGETLTEFRQELKPLLQEFANAYKELDENRVQQAFQNILNFIDRTKNETIVLDEALKETQATLRQMIQAEGAINIDKVVKGDLLNIFNSIEQVEQALTTVFGKKGVGWAFTEMGKTTFSGFDTVAEQFKIEYNNLAEGIAGLYDILSQPIPKGNVFNVIGDLNDLLNSLASSLNLPTNLFEIFGNDVNMLFANIDEISKMQTSVQGVDTAIQSLGIDAKQTDAAIEGLLADVNKYPDIAKITSGFSTNNADQLTYAKNQLNDYFTNIVQVEDKANRVKNAIADTEGELQRFYIQVEKGDKSVETLTYVLNEEANAYQFLSKSIREADNSTDFRRKGLDTLTEINTEKVSQFITQLKEANLYTGDLKTRADELKDSISKVTDTNAMNKFLDEFDIAKAKFQALKAESKSLIPTNEIKSAMSELDKIINNTQFSKQKNSLAGMIGDTNTLKDLQSSFEKTTSDARVAKQLYQELLNSLSKDSSPTAIAKVNTELEQLKSEFDTATTSAKNLQTQLDAIKTFSDAYSAIADIDKKLSSGNLLQADVDRLRAEREAQENIVTVARMKLETAGLYTNAIKNQNDALRTNTELINQQRAAQDEQKAYIDSIVKTYEELNKNTLRLMSGKATETETADLEKRSYALMEYLLLLERELNEKGLLQGEIKKVFDAEQEQRDAAIRYAAEEKASAEAIKQKAEETRKYNQELKETEKYINDAIAALQKFNNSAVAKKNSNNEFVQSQIGTNADLINRLTNWQSSLANNNTAPNLQRIKAEMDAYTASVNNAIKSSEALNRELRDTGANNTANANLEKLKNQMVSFSNANLKAVNSTKMMRDGVTTFAQGWQNLLERLNSGKLDAAGIQKLTQDFQVFKGEVNAAGLSVTRVFTNMGSQLRMLTQRYISLYAVINYIKKMVSAVKELDTAMINVRRVTDETAEGYEQFLVKANKMAQELNTTTSTLVESAYQFAKMSYDLNQSLDLAKSATIFAKVADIEESTAVTELIATMKAFNIEAEKAIDIVDKLDNLNNKFAVSASGLGEGLERSASALAMTGNTLEQTLAMLTGAGEITQQLDNTGRMIAREKLYRSKS